jgi:hypothetical protein
MANKQRCGAKSQGAAIENINDLKGQSHEKGDEKSHRASVYCRPYLSPAAVETG